MSRAGARAVLLLALACGCRAGGGPPGEAPVETAEPVADAAAETPATPDPESLWESCGTDPPRFEDCRRYVLAARGTPDLDGRLDRLAAAHPDSWIPPYLSGFHEHSTAAFDEAERHYRRAAGLARDAGDPYGEGESLYALATMLLRDGEVERAGALLDEALGLARRSGDRVLLTRVLQRIARTCRAEGRFFDERPARLELLALTDGDGNTEDRRKALYRVAENARQLGRHRDAQRDFERTLELARQAGDESLEASSSMALGILALDLREDRALERFESAAAAARRCGLDPLRAHAEMLAGVALLRAGRPEEARDRLRANLSGEVPLDDRLRFRTLVYLADAERECGRTREALELYREIEDMAPTVGLPDEWTDALVGLATLQRGLEHPGEAVDAARRAVARIESMRSNIAVFSERAHFLHVRADAYQTLAASLAELEPDETGEVYDVVERAHARTLLEIMAAPEGASKPRKRLALRDARARLGPGDLLLEYLLGDDESSLVAIDTNGASIHALPGRREIEDRVTAYREALVRPLSSIDARLDPEADFRRFAGTGAELYRVLLGPVAGRLRDAERLVIVPDRGLYLLPFEALLTAGARPGEPLRFLGVSHAVEYLPAAAFLETPSPAPVERVVVVAAGDGRDEPDLAPLRHAREEARAVVAAYGDKQVELLESDAARLDRLVEACSRRVDVLHLTAHAVLDSAAGPRIALEGEGPGSWLDVASLERLAVAPRRVVLSACGTAQGELVGGEGILGLVRAFTVAGSRQVVASLWVVDDRRTAALMGSLHGALDREGRTSLALRDARRASLGEGFVHPFYWAGFVLYGSD